MSNPSRLGEALVLREVRRRMAVGETSVALNLLDIASDVGTRDPLVWYAIGQEYEKAGNLARATACYLNGIGSEGQNTQAAGRYYLGVLFYKQRQWIRVIETLELLSRQPIEPQVRRAGQPELAGLSAPDWSGAFLLLGTAYEQTGRSDEARSLYERLLNAQSCSREWQVNRALASLASLEGRNGSVMEASTHFARALDLTLHYPSSSRDEYQAATWRQLLEFVGVTSHAGAVDQLLPAARSVVQATPESPSAWLVLALMATVACDDALARDASQKAAVLEPAVTPFLTRLADMHANPVWPQRRPRGCDSR